MFSFTFLIVVVGRVVNGQKAGGDHSSASSKEVDGGLCEDVFASLVEQMVTECAFEVHREVSLGYLDSNSTITHQDIFGTTRKTLNKLLCQCPVCQRSIGASRFAPHLDKCIQRSTRHRAGKANHRNWHPKTTGVSGQDESQFARSSQEVSRK